MENEKMYLKTITAKARKFYVGEAAMHIAKLLRDNCVSLQTRCLVVKGGYENAYTALAYQYNFGRDDSFEAILSDMQLAPLLYGVPLYAVCHTALSKLYLTSYHPLFPQLQRQYNYPFLKAYYLNKYRSDPCIL